MNESSLSQQLREAFTPGEDGQIHLTHELLSQIPQFLTEHEALQRKADAGEKLVNTMEDMELHGYQDRGAIIAEFEIKRDTALEAYREATKPSDV